MAGPTGPIDQAAEAGRLADLFNNLSQALDDFRLGDHIPPLTVDESARIKDQAQELEGLSQNFTAKSLMVWFPSFCSSLKVDLVASSTSRAASPRSETLPLKRRPHDGQCP